MPVETTIDQVMSPHLVTLFPGSSLDEAITLFLERHLNYIPVVREQSLVGIIHIIDVIKAYYDFLQDVKSGKITVSQV